MPPQQNIRELLSGVRARRTEVVELVLTRVRGIVSADQPSDGEYVHGVRRAVEAAIDHTIDATERATGRIPIPDSVLAQARLAARRGTPLEIVLRRYLAGHTVLSDLLAEEAEIRKTDPRILRRVLQAQAAETDRVLEMIGTTYRRESESSRPRTATWWRTDKVRRLLAGELLDPVGLDYELDRWHVGIVIDGPRTPDVFRVLTAGIDAACMAVPGDDGLLWGWVGYRRQPERQSSLPKLPSDLSAHHHVGVGEPSKGPVGWRLTHHQATAAESVSVRGGRAVVRYAEVALLASAIQDELLTTSLRTLYLEPLASGSVQANEVLRSTLRAYLEADGHVSSAAATLGVSRNTVTNRLRTIEARIGLLTGPSAGNVMLALRLEELTGVSMW